MKYIKNYPLLLPIGNRSGLAGLFAGTWLPGETLDGTGVNLERFYEHTWYVTRGQSRHSAGKLQFRDPSVYYYYQSWAPPPHLQNDQPIETKLETTSNLLPKNKLPQSLRIRIYIDGY